MITAVIVPLYFLSLMRAIRVLIKNKNAKVHWLILGGLNALFWVLVLVSLDESSRADANLPTRSWTLPLFAATTLVALGYHWFIVAKHKKTD